MTAFLNSDVLQDNIAVTIARVIALANQRANELDIDVVQSIISLTQIQQNNVWIWRVNYGAKDYIGRRGGDLIIDIDPEDVSIHSILWGQ